MPTAEIYRINENGTREYAGYARFDAEGNYLGSRGGYGSRAMERNGSRGRGTSYVGERPYNGGLPNQGNARNGASRLQNTINAAAARNGARTSTRRRR